MSGEQKSYKKLSARVKLIVKIIIAVFFTGVAGTIILFSLSIGGLININLNFFSQTYNNNYVGVGNMENNGDKSADGILEFKSDGLNPINIDITSGDKYIKNKYKAKDGKYIVEFSGVPPGGAIQMKTASDSVVTVAVIDLKENPKDKKFFAWLKKLFGH